MNKRKNQITNKVQQINRKNFLNQLQILLCGASNSDIIEQSSSLIFDKDRMYTFNDEISVNCPSILESNNFAINIFDLFSIINSSVDLTININISDNIFEIIGKKFKAQLPIQRDIKLPNIKYPAAMKELPKEFFDFIKYASITTTQTSSNAQFSCIHFNKNIIESTDEFRLTRCQLNSIMLKESILIPSIHLCKIKQEWNPKCFAVDDSFLCIFCEGSSTIAIRQLKAKYPSLEKHTKVSGKKVKWPINILKILERASNFFRDEIKIDEVVEIKIDKGLFTLTAKNKYGNKFIESTKIKYSGNPKIFKTSPSYIKDSCKLNKYFIISDEKIKINIGDNIVHIIQLWNKGV